MKARTITETFIVSAIGALLFAICHVPLPFLLGPIIAITLWNVFTKRELAWPSPLRKAALAVIGCMLGSSFAGADMSVFVPHLPYMAATSLLIVAFGVSLGFIIARLAGIRKLEGLFGGVPGGLSYIVALSSDLKNVQPTVIITMQVIRSMLVVFLIPFILFHGIADQEQPSAFSNFVWDGSEPLADYGVLIAFAVIGVYLGKLIRLPNSMLTGPLLVVCIASLLGVTIPHIPGIVLVFAQLCIGIQGGLQIKPEMLIRARKIALYALGSSLLLVGFTILLAWLLTILTPIDMTTALLSTAPGGIAEMGITAASIRVDLSVVSGYQLFRMFFVIFITLPLLQFLLKRVSRFTT